jgi:hypothetical protein
MLWHVMARAGTLVACGRRSEAGEPDSTGRSHLIEALAGCFPALLRRSPVAVLLALSLLAANALALHTPTDPVWSPGIYDEDVFDDTIALLSDPGEVAGPPRALGPIAPVGRLIGLVATTASAPSDVPASLARHFRSPPLP